MRLLVMSESEKTHKKIMMNHAAKNARAEIVGELVKCLELAREHRKDDVHLINTLMNEIEHMAEIEWGEDTITTFFENTVMIENFKTGAYKLFRMIV